MSGVAASRITAPASRSFSAAASRSRKDRSRASLDAASACANIAVETASKRSMTSSVADASSVRTKASKVAARRSSGSRATACALAVDAKRASAVTLPGGSRSASGSPAPIARISSDLATARPISGPLRMNGPSRSRSRGLCRAPSGTTTSASRRARCSVVSREVSRRNRWPVARERTRATARSSTDRPGNSTLAATSQATARSNSVEGRSVPVQQSA